MSESARSARLRGVNSDMADLSGIAIPAIESATKAFEHLYEDNRVPVLRFLIAFVGDEDQALELASQTFERAWNACRQGQTIGLGWLIRCARNAAVDASRRDAVRRRFSLRMRHPTEASAEDIVLRRDSSVTLRAAIAKLPSPQRDAVVLRFTTDLSVREIGNAIGRREDATEKLISRAIKKLREDFGDHF